MKYIVIRMSFLLLIMSLGASALDSPNVLGLRNIQPDRILFVGNSYLYYNDSLHNHVRRMVDERFPNRSDFQQYKSSTIGGSRLIHHNLDYLLNSKNIGINGKFELVILQGGSQEPLSKKSRDLFAKQAKVMINNARDNGGEVALYMTHAYAKSHPAYDPQMINKIGDLYLNVANDNKVLVIPVGLAFERAYSKSTDIKLHKEFDGTHPSLLGTYLAANVVFYSIFGSSPAGLKYNYYGAISDEDRLFLQNIAIETVTEFFK